MSVNSDLLHSYRQSRYRMQLPTGDCELLIGMPSRLLDDYLRSMACTDACFVSAHNPRSHRLPPALNRSRHAALEQLLQARRQRYCEGVGYATDTMSPWPAEPGFLVLDCGRELAAALGRLFGQNAVLVMHSGKPVELLCCTAPATGEKSSRQ